MRYHPTTFLGKIRTSIGKKLHLSVSLGDTGTTKIFTPPVWQFAFLVSVCLGFGFFGVLMSFPEEKTTPAYGAHKLFEGTRQTLAQTEALLVSTRQDAAFKEQKIKVFAHELGTLQARLERFEEIGEQLFQDKYFGQYLAELENIAPVGSAENSLPENPVSVFAMATQLASVKRRTDRVEKVMSTGQDLLNRTQLHRNMKPHHWPVVHKRSYVSSRYGWRHDPFKKNKNWHAGMDIAAAYNAPVVSSADGVVTFAGYRFGYGIMVEVTHGGEMTTRYAHLNRAIVHNNQSVRAGELLGLMGSTGRATGPHLHFELLVGEHKVDPYPFVKDGRENAKMLALSGMKAYDTSQF